jgi:hypothetical protein
MINLKHQTSAPMLPIDYRMNDIKPRNRIERVSVINIKQKALLVAAQGYRVQGKIDVTKNDGSLVSKL